MDDGWTKEQDEKLLALRAEKVDGPWADTANELGKEKSKCKERFNQIKPKEGELNNAKNGGTGRQKGQKGQQDKRNKKDNEKKDDEEKDDEKKDDGKKDDEKKDDKKKDEAAVGGLDSSANNGWGASSGDGNNGGGTGDGGWAGAADNKDENNKSDAGFKNNDNGWGTGNEDWNQDASWDNNNNSNNNVSNDNTSKKSSSKNSSSSNKYPKEPSNKAPSQPGSKQYSTRGSEKASALPPTEYELKPDSTFSANDLRLIAKILQQDCQMVWDRVSWRFQDKTGRKLHPDVFEKKVTGKVEKRGSERGGR